MSKNYYNHDHLWSLRTSQKKPVWGPHSESAYHNILNRVLHIHPTAVSICDAGCGAGAMGEFAVRRGLRYLGADESAVAIEMGKAHFTGLDLRHFDFVRGNPTDLGQKFSIIACINVLHCLTDPDDRHQILENLRAVAEPGGHLALSTMCLPVKSHFRKAESPRAYLEAEAIFKELELAGWRDLILREFIPADEVSPVTNVLIIAKSDYASG